MTVVLSFAVLSAAVSGPHRKSQNGRGRSLRLQALKLFRKTIILPNKALRSAHSATLEKPPRASQL